MASTFVLGSPQKNACPYVRRPSTACGGAPSRRAPWARAKLTDWYSCKVGTITSLREEVAREARRMEPTIIKKILYPHRAKFSPPGAYGGNQSIPYYSHPYPLTRIAAQAGEPRRKAGML